MIFFSDQTNLLSEKQMTVKVKQKLGTLEVFSFYYKDYYLF